MLLLFCISTLISTLTTSQVPILQSSLFTFAPNTTSLINRKGFVPTGCSYDDGAIALAWVVQVANAKEGFIYSQVFDANGNPNQQHKTALLVTTLHSLSIMCLPGKNYVLLYNYGTVTTYDYFDLYANRIFSKNLQLNFVPFISARLSDDNFILGSVSGSVYAILKLDRSTMTLSNVSRGSGYDKNAQGILTSDQEILFLSVDDNNEDYNLKIFELNGTVRVSSTIDFKANTSSIAKAVYLQDGTLLIASWSGGNSILGTIYSKDLAYVSNKTLFSLADGEGLTKLEILNLPDGKLALIYVSSYGKLNFFILNSDFIIVSETFEILESEFFAFGRQNGGFCILYTSSMSEFSIGCYDNNGNSVPMDFIGNYSQFPTIIKIAFGVWALLMAVCIYKCVKKIRKMRREWKRRQITFKKIEILKLSKENMETLSTEGTERGLREVEIKELRKIQSEKLSRFKTVKVPLHKIKSSM